MLAGTEHDICDNNNRDNNCDIDLNANHDIHPGDNHNTCACNHDCPRADCTCRPERGGLLQG